MRVDVKFDTKKVTAALSGVEDLSKSLRNQATRDLAVILQRQMRQRIAKKKQSPDGESWPEWSPQYAATRGPQHSLLVATRTLLRGFRVRGRAGGFTLSGPHYTEHVNEKRSFIGIGDDDVPELQRALNRWAEKEMARRVRV